VAPPEEEPPTVDLGEFGEEADEKAADTSPALTPSRPRRWTSLAVGALAVGLLLAIVVLATTLTPSPAPRDTDETADQTSLPPVVDVQPTIAAQPSPASTAPSAHPPASAPSSAGKAVADDESEFWIWLTEADAEDPAPPDEPEKPASIAKEAPKSTGEKPDPKTAMPAQGAPVVASNTTPANQPPPSTPASEPPPKKPELKPEPFKTVAQLDPILADAWNLIRRGEYVKGRDRLVHASKLNREDLRVPFSLGLVDALVNHDWAAAEKEFQQCVQEQPKHVASLNNLALVRLRLNRETQSLRHWQTALAEGPPSDAVVQNLGRVRYLLQKGRYSFKPVTQKAFNNLYVDAQRATSARFDERVGYRFMGLYGGGSPDFGWSEPHDYEDRWCPVCNATGKMKCPERDCKNGTRPRMVSKFFGQNPITKTPIYDTSVAKVPCTTCSGTGWYSCSFCREGKDSQLK